MKNTNTNISTEESNLRGALRQPLMIGTFNATEAARELISNAQEDTAMINEEDDDCEMDLNTMIDARLEILDSEEGQEIDRALYLALLAEVALFQELPLAEFEAEFGKASN